MNMQKILAQIIIIGCLLLAGCATVKTPDPRDPYENINRGIFKFNLAFDKVILKPITKTYHFILPNFAQKGINNFFFNIAETVTIVNDILQLDFRKTAVDTSRLAINTTLGIVGLIDVAARMNLQPSYNDLGVTLAKWGAKDTPYVMLPIIGPTTVANGIGLAIDYYAFSVFPYLKNDVRLPLLGLLLVDLRNSLLPADKLMEQALDPYVFVRNAYLQRRERMLHRHAKHLEDIDPYIEESATTTEQKK